MDGCFQTASEGAVLVVANSSLGKFCSVSRAGTLQLDMGNALLSPTFPAIHVGQMSLIVSEK